VTAGRRRGGDAERGDRCARERLLREAAGLFNRKGYAATSVGEIVAAAGVTRPVLYYHFESKAGLYLAILEDAVGRLRPAVEASLRDDGTVAPDRVRGLCAAIVACALENLEVVRLVRSLHHSPPQGAPAFDVWEFPLTIKDVLTRIVEEGVRSRQIARVAPEDLVWTVLGLVNVFVDSNLAERSIALSAAGFRAALDLVLAAVAPPAAAPGRRTACERADRPPTSHSPRRPKKR
jgi:AcrR family transcriptional regulator